jgi:hypothetical protein
MKYKTDVFEDIMGIVIETNDPFLNKVLNKNICYKGGGSTTTVQSPELPTEFRPFASAFAQQLQGAMGAGNVFGQVAPESQYVGQAQQMAVDRAGDIAAMADPAIAAQQQALTGTGLFGEFGGQDLSAVKDALKGEARDLLANERVGQMGMGTMGGARAQLREGGIEGGLAGKLGDLQYKELMARRQAQQQAISALPGLQSAATQDIAMLKGVGAEQTARAQTEAEAQARGLKEIGSIFTGIPVGSTTTQSGGGK